MHVIYPLLFYLDNLERQNMTFNILPSEMVQQGGKYTKEGSKEPKEQKKIANFFFLILDSKLNNTVVKVRSYSYSF